MIPEKREQEDFQIGSAPADITPPKLPRTEVDFRPAPPEKKTEQVRVEESNEIELIAQQPIEKAVNQAKKNPRLLDQLHAWLVRHNK